LFSMDTEAGRGKRGASYMDQYETNYDDSMYSPSAQKQGLTGCAKCSKHMLFAVNFIMLLIGVALVVVVFFVRENNEAAGGNLEFAMSDTIVWLCVAVGAFIIIVSFLGCVGATTESRCLLMVFIGFLVLCLILEIVGIAIIFTDDDLIRKSIESQWDNLSDDQQETYEQDNDCSDFDDCYESLEEGLQSNLYLIGGITIGVFCYQMVMTVLACCLCKRSKPKHNMEDP